MRRTVKSLVTLVTVLLLVFVAGCVPAPAEITPAPAPTPEPTPAPTPTVERGIIEIRVTDPPPPGVDSANVTLTKLEVHQVSDNGSGWITIIEEEVTFDLFEIIDQAMTLGSADVTAGKYTQIRAEVTGVEGLTKAGNPYKAEVPSGTLKFVRPFNVEAGITTVLTLDFDGDKSLVMTGKDKFLFKPVVKLLIEHEEEREREREREREGEEEELEFEGTIKEIIDENTWTMTIDDEEWTVDVSGADIEGEPAVGLEAEVEGIVVNDTIVASEVEIKEPEEAEEEEEFEGTIDSIDGDNWTMTIDDEEWTVDVSGADIEGEPAVGLEAEVEGTVVDDTIVASEVKIKEAEEEEEFEGTIDSIDGDNWTMTIDDEEWTVDVSGADIEGEPAVGLEAKVEGTVVDDTIVASEVEIKEPEEAEEELEFEGTIKEIIDENTWTMTIDGEEWTVDVSGADIEGEPAVGLEAEVKGTVVNDTIVASEVEIKEEE